MTTEELRTSLLAEKKNGYARSRISAQHNETLFREHCDYTLVNDGTQARFREKCLAFLQNPDIIIE